MKMKLTAVAIGIFVVSIVTASAVGMFSSWSNQTAAASEDSILAYSAYIMSGFAQVDTQDNTTIDPVNTANYDSDIVNINAPSFDQFLIAEDFQEVAAYFEHLKVFLDNDMNEALDLQAVEIPAEYAQYENAISFNAEDSTYEIYYNQNQDQQINGVLIFNTIEYNLTGVNEFEQEDGEQEHEIEFRAVDPNNTNNWINMAVEVEQETDEYSYQMYVEKSINGAYSEYELEMSNETGEVEISLAMANELELKEFSFEKETELDEVEYSFEYSIGGNAGEVEVEIYNNVDGNAVYEYKIQENGNEYTYTEQQETTEEEQVV
jgi:hypothetical protein